MPTSPSPGPPGGYGFTAWFVFVVAVAAVLTLSVGCMTTLYAPIFTGGAG
ncbi:hypothetical protein [Nocardiopsis ansamitocini]|uniref:Uncharacterized protein n=1 Tax=Nocardiopsis ansamitocini TaxID=1670832 RepID=A0A9W6P318_9ACTN|nr:hypothetical protein [Nocardiopsis ansamitocini]GLU46213.1 hypothetical protein Nans01_05640 [Nocardiopsis ansamitocini]